MSLSANSISRKSGGPRRFVPAVDRGTWLPVIVVVALVIAFSWMSPTFW